MRYPCWNAALALLAAGVLVASGARADGFKMYQLLVFCGNSQVATVIFGHTVDEPSMGTKVICAGNCPGGWVSIADAVAGLPAGVSASLTAKVEKHKANTAAGKKGPSLAGCDCDNEKIDRLKGLIRGLSEAIKAHEKDRRAKELARYEARDRLWGKGEGLRFETGSIADFGQSALDTMLLTTGGGASGVGKAYGSVRKAYNEAKGWGELGWSLGSDPGDVEHWGELGGKLLEMQADAILKQRSLESIRAMNQHYQKTGNGPAAQNVYRQRWGGYGGLKNFKSSADKVTGQANKLASALGTLAKLAENTDRVTEDLSDWLLKYNEQNSIDKQIAAAEAKRDAAQEQLSALLAVCAAAPKSSLGWGFWLTAAQAAAAKGGYDPKVARLAEDALRELKALQAGLRDADRRVGRQVIAPFSPWLAGAWRGAEPRPLLVALVKAAKGDLAQYDGVLARLELRADVALKALRRLPRDGVPGTGI